MPKYFLIKSQYCLNEIDRIVFTSIILKIYVRSFSDGLTFRKKQEDVIKSIKSFMLRVIVYC
jgi:hypothetical protein